MPLEGYDSQKELRNYIGSLMKITPKMERAAINCRSYTPVHLTPHTNSGNTNVLFVKGKGMFRIYLCQMTTLCTDVDNSDR